MKPIVLNAAGAIALTFTIAACVPSPDSTPAPEPVRTRPALAPKPAPHPNWMDAPATAGDWSYSFEQIASGRQSLAEFNGTNGNRLFRVTCAPGGSVSLVRMGEASRASQMTIRTESTSHTLATQPVTEDQAFTTAIIGARDPLLDAMALSKGRFAVEVIGSPALFLPSWAEVTRVIEDCR